MGNALENLRHLIDCYGWRDNRDMQDFIDAADMIDMQYVELPKDADGIEIRVGDDMEVATGAMQGEHSAVEYLALTESGWEVDGEPPQSLRHYQPPKVADLLRQFTRDWCEAACVGKMGNAERNANIDNVIAKYVDKLRLADDGKEQ